MKKPSAPDEPQVRRILKAQSRVARLRMRFAMRFKRCLWLAVVNGTHAVQRLFDIVISIIALILAAPLMAVIALLIRRDGGPAFFKQRRVGFHGCDFELLKFRSTCVDAEGKRMSDPQVTPMGRFIRKASIDELPQFFNVLRGDMSIVGPRPYLPQEATLYSSAGCRRLLARPGITCLWEVDERKGRLWESGDQSSLYMSYIESHSFGRDFWILLKTVPAIVLGKSV
ncbi:MAG: sugar transferase [Prosthecobacter sp.]|nr:sugar transferase [Prosthecobacter sp.]